MTDEAKPKRKPDGCTSKGRKKPYNRQARNSKIVDMAMNGMTNKEIAAELGLHRQTVGNVLSSQESKDMIDRARSDLHRSLTVAIQTFMDAMENRHADMKTAAVVAAHILKGLGVLAERQEVSVLKPFVIKKLNGDEVILGHKAESEDENGEEN
jgi:DNA-binding MarR family transcriptional regulator